MTIRDVDTLVLFDPMSHSKQSYVAISCGFFCDITLFHSGTLELATMGPMESSHSLPNTAATTFVVVSNSTLCRRKAKEILTLKTPKSRESYYFFFGGSIILDLVQVM
jgi:hypothetical protein